MTKKLLVAAGLLAKSQVAAFTRKDGVMVQAHDNGRQAAAPKPAATGRQAPAPGEVGHEEHQQYGVHFKKGDKVKDRYGKSHEVLSHHGPEVKTASGESFHPTKLWHADGGNQASAPKPAAGAHPKGFSTGQSVFVKHPATGKKTIATYQGAKDGKSVVQHDKLGTLHVDHEHVTPALGVPKRADPAASRAAGDDVRAAMAANSTKTGSAAPAKMKNVGTDKWPLHAKSSESLGAKHPDGSTHHVGGFEPPAHGNGDHLIHHDGKTFGFSGKTGKNMKTGEDSFEYSAGDTGEHRAWVTRSGHLQND